MAGAFDMTLTAEFEPSTGAPHPSEPLLDFPVRASLTGNWGDIAERNGGAAALPRAIGPFAAMDLEREPDHAGLASLIRARGEAVVLVGPKVVTAAGDLFVVDSFEAVQMVLRRPLGKVEARDVDELGPQHAQQMFDLAHLTNPGPFEIETHRLGAFIGHWENGRLLAMVGQRMGFAGWTEVSAVCVHPDARGRGLARHLMIEMMRRLEEQVITPFLHSYASNAAAIQLYESLGFEIRSAMKGTIMGVNG